MLLKNKNKEKKKTAVFTWFVLYWFLMFIVGFIIFFAKYPNSDTSGLEYQDFFWHWFQLAISTFLIWEIYRGKILNKFLDKFNEK